MIVELALGPDFEEFFQGAEAGHQADVA